MTTLRLILLVSSTLCILALLPAPASADPGGTPGQPPGRWKKIRGVAPDADLSEEERQTWERLRSIGYVGGSVADDRRGVTISDAATANRQLNFFTSGHAPEAILMDMKGNVLHRWHYAFADAWPDSPDRGRLGSTWWRRAHLFENGDLLAIFEGLGIIKIDRNSKLIWANPIGAHHDLEVLPSGEIYVLTRAIRHDLSAFEGSMIVEDYLSILGSDGKEKRRISILQALERSPFRSFMEDRKHRVGDIFHTNTVHVLDGRLADREAAFRRGNVLLSMNGLGVIAVLDLEREEITWARKRPPQGQHDPQILDDGHLLYFDNREDEGASIVTELDPVTDQEHWSYRGTNQQPFYSRYCGSAQRLANGNTLITESDGGRAFEVNAAGEIVWEFYNPHRAGPEAQFIASISEMLRISPEYVSGWLKASSGAARRPNIVILLADDLGWEDVGYHGGDIRTPNIDRLADEGARLERFYTAPSCSPTRAGLLTGRYPLRFGMMRSVITPWSPHGLPAEERTLAELLRDAGYTERAIVGKWHLGHASREFHPLSQGFTHFYGHLNGAIGYFSHRREGALDWHRDWKISHDRGYSTDLIGSEAVRLIEESPAGEPFFLLVAFNAPHGPLAAKDEDLEKYTDREGPRRTYAAMVDSMDQAIGGILDALEAKGLAENTLVLFASDNGADRFGNSHPLRGGKSTVYEGGIRVPAVIRWPGGISGRRSIEAPMGYIDVYPTLKRIVGLDTPDPNPLDGRDMLDVIRGSAEAPPRDWFSFFAPDQRERIAVASGKWKLVVQGPSVLEAGAIDSAKIELFDIQSDPDEKLDLAGRYPETVSDLLERLRKFRRLQVAGVGGFEEGHSGFQAPEDWSIPD